MLLSTNCPAGALRRKGSKSIQNMSSQEEYEHKVQGPPKEWNLPNILTLVSFVSVCASV